MKNGRPEKLWGNGINLSGLWWDKPKRLRWRGGSWWDHSGDFDVEQAGQSRKEWGIITFASQSKAEAEAWTLGVKAVQARLREWCGGE